MDDQRFHKNSIPFFVLLLGSLVGCSTSGVREVSDTEKARMILDVANAALNENDPISALMQLDRAQELDAKVPEIYHSRALALYLKKENAKAILEAKHAVELNPSYSDARNTLGKLLMDSGRYVEAEQHLSVAAQDTLYRDGYKAKTNLGIIAYRKGQLDVAHKLLSQAVDSEPNSTCIAYYYRGHIELQRANVDRAIRDYERATQRFCGAFVEAHFAIGVALQRDKRFDQARKKFVEISRIYPDSKYSEQALERIRALP